MRPLTNRLILAGKRPSVAVCVDCRVVTRYLPNGRNGCLLQYSPFAPQLAASILAAIKMSKIAVARRRRIRESKTARRCCFFDLLKRIGSYYLTDVYCKFIIRRFRLWNFRFEIKIFDCFRETSYAKSPTKYRRGRHRSIHGDCTAERENRSGRHRCERRKIELCRCPIFNRFGCAGSQSI